MLVLFDKWVAWLSGVAPSALTALSLLFLPIGLFGFAFYLAWTRQRWVIESTFLLGQPVVYDESYRTFVMNSLIFIVQVLGTLGLYTPWAFARIRRERLRHIRFEDGRRFVFTGTGGQVVWLALASTLLVPLTCWLASPWLRVRWKQWEWSHTHIVDCDKPEPEEAIEGQRYAQMSLEFGATGWDLVKLYGWSGFFMLASFGLYEPWHRMNVLKWEIENIYLRRQLSAVA